MFLDAAEQDLHPDWARAAAGMVAAFRASIGTDVEDPRIAQLVGELSLASEPFRQLWARHDVKPLAGELARMHHPQVGLLELRREKLSIGDSGGQLLVIYHAEPGSDSARSLALLGSLAAFDETPAGQTAADEAGTAALAATRAAGGRGQSAWRDSAIFCIAAYPGVLAMMRLSPPVPGPTRTERRR